MVERGITTLEMERLVGTIRRESLDRPLFWTPADLENILLDFKTYLNRHCSHTAPEGRMPDPDALISSPLSIPMDGNPTVEVSITPRSLPDSPKTHDSLGFLRTTPDCPPMETSGYWRR
jgi:hypothetical protein